MRLIGGRYEGTLCEIAPINIVISRLMLYAAIPCVLLCLSCVHRIGCFMGVFYQFLFVGQVRVREDGSGRGEGYQGSTLNNSPWFGLWVFRSRSRCICYLLVYCAMRTMDVLCIEGAAIDCKLHTVSAIEQ